ncbi:MAG: immunoglobulin domain-containing protein [Hoeflea sp.]|nr:immunoglobulin domain-containing protein [Alphaproteobacteria bacterium]MBU4542656.1 immunoglobulin domain-containing protein [Alphaproteobacteria bacterium]MBV1760171.1 immunoglobulin domain-containing protein [Hoeflea sp.]MBV1782828.1 immunoglobulin domain-containing protein [Hoeflea sp.]
MSFSAVEPDGDTIVLKSVRMQAPGDPALELGDITFTGVEEDDDGSYYVDETAFADINMEKEGIRLTVADIELYGLTVPARPGYDTMDNIVFYEGLSTGRIAVEKDGKETFSMASMTQEVERADDDSSVSLTMDGSDMAIDLSEIDDPKAKAALSELGYTNLTGDFKIDGKWEVEPGIFNMREYSLRLDDVGRLAMSLEISGYTLEFIKALQQAQTAAQINPDPKAAQQAMGFAMMGMLQQLSFNSASIQFQDDSLTGKALAYAGKQQGVTGEQMGQSLKFMVPMMLGQLGIPALQQQITAAANAFLDNPQTFTITAKPANPVGVPMIMGAGMGDPKSLVDLLNVKVTANDPVLLCCE